MQQAVDYWLLPIRVQASSCPLTAALLSLTGVIKYCIYTFAVFLILIGIMLVSNCSLRRAPKAKYFTTDLKTEHFVATSDSAH